MSANLPSQLEIHRLMSTILAAALLTASQAWVSPVSRFDATAVRASPVVLMASAGQGFGKPKPAPKNAAKPKTEGAVKRDKASQGARPRSGEACIISSCTWHTVP